MTARKGVAVDIHHGHDVHGVRPSENSFENEPTYRRKRDTESYDDRRFRVTRKYQVAQYQDDEQTHQRTTAQGCDVLPKVQSEGLFVRHAALATQPCPDRPIERRCRLF